MGTKSSSPAGPRVCIFVLWCNTGLLLVPQLTFPQFGKKERLNQDIIEEKENYKRVTTGQICKTPVQHDKRLRNNIYLNILNLKMKNRAFSSPYNITYHLTIPNGFHAPFIICRLFFCLFFFVCLFVFCIHRCSAQGFILFCAFRCLWFVLEHPPPPFPHTHFFKYSFHMFLI